MLPTSKIAFCVYKCTACYFADLQNGVLSYNRKFGIGIGVISVTRSLILSWTHEKDCQHSLASFMRLLLVVSHLFIFLMQQ